MRGLIAALVLGLATASAAGTVNCPQGWLAGPAPQAAAVVGPNNIAVRAVPSLIIQAVSPAGTATVQMEACCSPLDCATGADWAPIGTPLSLTAAAPSALLTIATPACMYRANVTACTDCRVNVVAVCSGS
jgi:hypothetical protein